MKIALIGTSPIMTLLALKIYKKHEVTIFEKIPLKVKNTGPLVQEFVKQKGARPRWQFSCSLRSSLGTIRSDQSKCASFSGTV